MSAGGDAAGGREAAAHLKIAKIDLDESSIARRSPEIEHERKVAIYDLLQDNHFVPLKGEEPLPGGPYELRLAVEDDRLILDVTASRPETEDAAAARHAVGLSLKPFRRIIKEYFQICEAYFEAIRHANPSKIEAIDMGRRGVHDEGSQVLTERLKGKIELDHPTARRLFTLICVLHIRA